MSRIEKIIQNSVELGAYQTKDQEAIQRVRELHSPVFHCSDCTAEVCDECDSHRHDNMSWQIKYPCDTIKALDGEQ